MARQDFWSRKNAREKGGVRGDVMRYRVIRMGTMYNEPWDSTQINRNG